MDNHFLTGIGIALIIVEIALILLTIVIALVALWGWYSLKEWIKSTASKIAEEIAEQKVSHFLKGEELKRMLDEAIKDRVVFLTPSSDGEIQHPLKRSSDQEEGE